MLGLLGKPGGAGQPDDKEKGQGQGRGADVATPTGTGTSRASASTAPPLSVVVRAALGTGPSSTSLSPALRGILTQQGQQRLGRILGQQGHDVGIGGTQSGATVLRRERPSLVANPIGTGPTPGVGSLQPSAPEPAAAAAKPAPAPAAPCFSFGETSEWAGSSEYDASRFFEFFRRRSYGRQSTTILA